MSTDGDPNTPGGIPVRPDAPLPPPPSAEWVPFPEGPTVADLPEVPPPPAYEPPPGPPPPRGMQPQTVAPPPPPAPPAYGPAPAYPPAAYPPPAPGAGYPPPAYGPDAATLSGAPKRNRKPLIIGIVAGFLLCCVLASCGLLAWGYRLTSDEEKVVNQAEAHFEAARSTLETGTAALDQIDTEGADRNATLLAAAERQLTLGRKEADAALAKARELDDSNGKIDYTKALDKLTEGFNGLQDLIGYLRGALATQAKADQATSIAQTASEDLNDSIDAGNAKNWTVMRRTAQAASAGCAKAARLFREAAALDKTAGYDIKARYEDKVKEQADLAATMAAMGSDGRASAYNGNIDRQSTLRKQASAIWSEASLQQPESIRTHVTSMKQRITEAAKASDELRKAALDELDNGD
jgi:hypothetical protein